MDNIDELQKKILNKKFDKSKNIGYDSFDVDSFFDEIISLLSSYHKHFVQFKDDINILNEKNNALKLQINDLLEKNKNLLAENERLKKEGYGNYDLQKKISDLEKRMEGVRKDENCNK